MKGKIAVFSFLLLVISYFIYEFTGTPEGKSNKANNNPNLVEGVIVNKVTEKPLKGVLISIRGYNPSASTDDDGHFYIEAKTSDELILKCEGFASQIISAADTKKVYMYPLEENKETDK